MLQRGRAFDDALAEGAERFSIEARDRAFARAMSAAVLRNCGALRAVVAKFMERGWPNDSGRLEPIFLAAAAQLLVLKIPPHAVISIAVEQCRADFKARRFDKLANAVLRRVSEQGTAILSSLDSDRLNVPVWLFERWRKTYGDETALLIAHASLQEAPIDLTIKGEPAVWAEKLGGRVLNTGTVRLASGGRVEDLTGFSEGAWWVQDAAAALPVKMLGDVQGLVVADLCAAPGGKTAQLAALGARVTALDQSPDRLQRLKANLKRLNLEAETVTADAADWTPGCQFDAVLIDAPCTATGTIRRHPDIMYLKRAGDIAALAGKQAKILDAAAPLVKPGGRMVFCTCSLEPEEGPDQVASFLSRHPEFARSPVDPNRIGGQTDFLDANGDLRTLPQYFSAFPRGEQGMDGFFAALLTRKI